jgi:hypothetical protein
MPYRVPRDPMHRAWERFKRLFQRNPAEPAEPDDPYAYVGAPKKPRPPLRGSAVAVDPES